MEDANFDKIFKAYDIRGVYSKEINEDLSYKIGQALVYLFKCKKIIVGRDKRKSSPKLFKALVNGITSLGCDVIDVVYTTTPLLYFSVGESQADIGIMITASHNPPQYNGFKITEKNAIPLRSKDIKKIKEIIKTKKFKIGTNKGEIVKKDFSKKYVEKLLEYYKNNKKLKIIIDTGNGMSGPITKQLLFKLPIESYYINEKIDFENASHEPNPLKIETLKDLQKEVILKKADLGVSFDGDGDRIGFVDEKGNIIPMDLITAVISKELIKKKSKIIYDLRSSKIVREVIIEKNGLPIEYRVGHTFIKRKMRSINAVFAGEVSGHYYFPDFYYSECPLLVLIMILNLLENKSLSKIIRSYKKYYKSEEINFRVINARKKIKEIKEIYSKLPYAKISTIDGLKIEFSDWWFNIRKSNTEDLLRLNLEADSKKLLKEKLKEVYDLIYK